MRFRVVRVGDPTVDLRAVQGDWTAPVLKTICMNGPDDFTLLNKPFSVLGADDWNKPGSDKLQLYTLHYHNDLSAVDADARIDWHRRFIGRWVSENPVGQGNGWEPYPISLRIVNWIKWHFLSEKLNAEALKSLWIQAKVLEQTVEHHLLANHILANAKGLYFAGVFFQGKDAERWLAEASSLLQREITEQVLPDGGHFELSPAYHAIILEDLLDIINLSRCYDLQPPRAATEAIEPMLSWLRCMTHPDGEVSYFNDSVGNTAPKVRELQAYAARLGFSEDHHEESGLWYLPESGYVRLDKGSAAVFVDVGNVGPAYQPGHGHCDCLSFELSVDSQRTLVNRGVSTYNVGKQRTSERATNAHNTVSIGAAEQSEIWSAFRIGRRAKPMDVEVADDTVSAAHNGWSRLGIVHRRKLVLRDNVLEINDNLEEGAGNVTKGTAHFHFHPDIYVTARTDSAEFDGGAVIFDNSDEVVLETYDYCLGFGDTVPAQVLRVSFTSQLTSKITYANSVSN